MSEARLVFIAGQVPLNERGELIGYEGQLVEIECTAALPLDQLGHQSG